MASILNKYTTLFFTVVVFLQFPSIATASHCENGIAIAISVQGIVEEKKENQWSPVKRDAEFCAGDLVRVRKNSRAIVRLIKEQTNITLAQHTTISFSAQKENKWTWLELFKGAANFISRMPQALKVRTPYVNAAIEGTEFLITVKEDHSEVSVFEGHVALSNENGKLDLKTGDTGIAKEGQAPAQSIKVNPVDAVQWTMYYPPIISKPKNAPDGNFPPTLENNNDPNLLTYYASQFLAVGRVEQAEQNIEKALSIDRGDSNALALKSIIAIVKNDKESALNFAKLAVDNNPSAAAHIALSYAYQAHFDLTAALDAAKEATKTEPNNGIAWARLAELWLSQGDLDRALSAAKKATKYNPELAHTQTILGFSYLTKIRTGKAKKTFEKAISLDQAAPLPHLGLGLAMIREGHLEQGRIEIEAATSLDPRNSLIRSYVGKAYYEEKHNDLAAEQFALAKQLDPKDPTPWFYDAIRKQVENDPVNALNDLQESIKLNDNRAVYRSSLLLDNDEASRSASQARIYSDLGFDQLGLLKGWESSSNDPSNYSSHRLLADSYSSLPRHEIARVSELLQAQLLQPININPIQPQLAESSLGILQGAGPSALSFNEFNPIFIRNGTSAQINVIKGNNSTVGDDFVISNLFNNTAFSVGQFHYKTDGFRANNDQTHDIFDIFAQIAITPKFNIQAEYREKETEQGDIVLNFDPTDFSTSDRRAIDQDTKRFGLHYSYSQKSNFLISLLSSKRNGSSNASSASGPIIDQNIDEDGQQYEFQHIYTHSIFNTIAGISSYKIELDQRRIFDWTPTSFGVKCPTSPPFPPFITLPPCEDQSEFSVDHDTAYIYGNLSFPNGFIWSLGLSQDKLKNRGLDINDTNPKFGLTKKLTNNHKIRVAYFKTVNRTLLVNQSTEPTQIAGFNQFFDEKNGTKSKRVGLGIDSVFYDRFYVGLEGSRRKLDVPQFSGINLIGLEDRDEELYRAYFYWNPITSISLSAELQHEEIDNNALGPQKVRTTSLPILINYFSSNQYSLSLKSTFIDQKTTLDPSSTFNKNKDNFVITDFSIAYRFPLHMGKISLEIKNLFDKEFLFQDLSDFSSEPVAPRFIPERTVFIRAVLNI